MMSRILPRLHLNLDARPRVYAAQVANYQYKSKGNDLSIRYLELFYSIAEMDQSTVKEASEKALIAKRLEVNSDHIMAVLKSINDEAVNKTEPIAVLTNRGSPRAKAIQLLDAHAGTDQFMGHR